MAVDPGALSSVEQFRLIRASLDRIETALATKADAAPVLSLMSRVDAIDRGEFSRGHRLALEEIIDDASEGRESKRYSGRDRIFARVGVAIAALALAVSTAANLRTFA
jgi:hypothetical protein